MLVASLIKVNFIPRPKAEVSDAKNGLLHYVCV